MKRKKDSAARRGQAVMIQSQHNAMVCLLVVAMVAVQVAINVSAQQHSHHMKRRSYTEEEKEKYLDHRAKLEKLWWAAHDNDMDAAKKAIAEGADINGFYHNEAPIHKAAAQGHEEMVRFLVESGANINHKHGSHKRTALKHAAYRGHLHVVKALHEMGADLHAKGTFHEGHKDAHGWAVHHGHDEVAEYLKKAKEDDLKKKEEALEKRMEGHTKKNLEEERKHRNLPPIGANEAASEL